MKVQIDFHVPPLVIDASHPDDVEDFRNDPLEFISAFVADAKSDYAWKVIEE